jgi:hypothetical protein
MANHTEKHRRAMLFCQFDFELYETGRGDVDCYYDQISPGVMHGSQGVRVKVKVSKDQRFKFNCREIENKNKKK